MTWSAVLALAAGTYALKAAGPLFLGGRAIPPLVRQALTLAAVALLGALVAVSTLADGRSLDADARLAGVVAGGVALVFRAPFAVVVVVAAAVAAGLRALGWS
jgi:branched-subunit amino acid transport protein